MTGKHRVTSARLSIEACKTDNVALLEEAVSIASQSAARESAQDIVQRSLKRAAGRQAVNVLRHLLHRSAYVHAITGPDLIRAGDEIVKPSLEVLEILLAHGWDINTQGSQGNDWPLLWLIVEHHDLVAWCLDHGASVDIPDAPPQQHADGTQSSLARPRPTILGAAASSGTVDTFKLLRSKGAPLDPRTLHLAVEQAALLAPAVSSDPSTSYTRRMDMVRHLVDVVALDVNRVEYVVGSMCTTPLCYVARRPTKQDSGDLVSFLLERGANTELGGGVQGGVEFPSPMKCAEGCGNEGFLRTVREWQEENQ